MARRIPEGENNYFNESQISVPVPGLICIFHLFCARGPGTVIWCSVFSKKRTYQFNDLVQIEFGISWRAGLVLQKVVLWEQCASLGRVKLFGKCRDLA